MIMMASLVILINGQGFSTEGALLATSYAVIAPTASISPTPFVAQNNGSSNTSSFHGSSTAIPTATHSLTVVYSSLVPSSMYATSSVSMANYTASISGSIHPASMSPHIVVSSSLTPTHKPTDHTVIKCGKECQTLKKRLYTSAVFAILFLIVSIVLGVLLYRQYRISKDYQNDPSLSRLI